MLAEIPIAQLRVFLHVLDAKSYRIAADKVLRSQPAVSKIIQLLEEKLGACGAQVRRIKGDGGSED